VCEVLTHRYVVGGGGGVLKIRGPLEKLVDRWQRAGVMQRVAVTIMLSCSGGGNVVVALSSFLYPSLEFELRSF
jgi:hypothetical protein